MYKEGYIASGVAAVLCARHAFVRPNGVGDLQKGEKYVIIVCVNLQVPFIYLYAISDISISILLFSPPLLESFLLSCLYPMMLHASIARTFEKGSISSLKICRIFLHESNFIGLCRRNILLFMDQITPSTLSIFSRVSGGLMEKVLSLVGRI